MKKVRSVRRRKQKMEVMKRGGRAYDKRKGEIGMCSE